MARQKKATRPAPARASDGRSRLLWGALLVIAGGLAWAFARQSPERPRRPARDELVEIEILTPDAGNPPSDGAAALPALTEGDRALMGSPWHIGVSGAADPAAARAAIERAFDEVARLEAVLSEWQPRSEISRVNAAAGASPMRVGPELMTCVNASLQVARWSDGAFDISWAALRGLWDFGPESAHIPPTPEAVRAKLPLWNYRNIVVDEAASTIFLRERGMAIGLGGVAKGYALDRAAEVLRAAGLHDFVIFGGGQVLVGGKRGARGWRVGIQHPRSPERYFAFLEVEGPMSVSTSGDYEHTWEHEGRRYHHILDPRTGFPSERTASVTLLSPSALWADAVDTAVFILGPRRGIDALAAAPGGAYEAIVVDPELRLSTTPGTERRLVMRATLDGEHRLGAWVDADAAPATLPPLPPRDESRPARVPAP
jgi:thiamine biosynthesis lipoprotein